ncbi:hypothetical protein ACFQ3Z_06525 [Streptomyces nogalater]
MIDAVLHEALAIGRAPAGHVQFVDPAVNALTLETHHGCAEPVLDHLVRGRSDGTADAAARTRCRQVGVPDVATDPLLADDCRAPCWPATPGPCTAFRCSPRPVRAPA